MEIHYLTDMHCHMYIHINASDNNVFLLFILSLVFLIIAWLLNMLFLIRQRIKWSKHGYVIMHGNYLQIQVYYYVIHVYLVLNVLKWIYQNMNII